VEALHDFLPLFQHSPDARTIAAGTALFRENEPGDALYVVLAGQVEIRIGDRAVETVGPGGIVGEMALVDRTPRSGSAVAVSEARVVPVDERWFLFLIQQTPFFALKVMHVMAQRLRRENARA
jgi:CRP-like cAMP-binding protein